MEHEAAKDAFGRLYRDQQPPWDIPGPQPCIVDAAREVTGPLLDVGCGTGENALFFAARGLDVTGIELVDEAVEQARRKASERDLRAAFLVKDALTLVDWDRRFHSAIDSGLFHVFSEADRTRYVEGLAHVLEPEGRLFLICFSEHEPGTHGPNRITRGDLRQAFAAGWIIQGITPTRYAIVPGVKHFEFSAGGAQAWFLKARRSSA